MLRIKRKSGTFQNAAPVVDNEISDIVQFCISQYSIFPQSMTTEHMSAEHPLEGWRSNNVPNTLPATPVLSLIRIGLSWTTTGMSHHRCVRTCLWGCANVERGNQTAHASKTQSFILDAMSAKPPMTLSRQSSVLLQITVTGHRVSSSSPTGVWSGRFGPTWKKGNVDVENCSVSTAWRTLRMTSSMFVSLPAMWWKQEAVESTTPVIPH